MTPIRTWGCSRQAARTVSRNFSTSILSRPLSLDSDCAEDSTRADAEPVSPARRSTSVILVATSAVLRAAAPTLRAISWVAVPCSSTAAKMLEEISEILPIVTQISLIAATDSWVAVCRPAICEPISSVAFAVWAASALTSWATTAKPLPAAPARAASIVALSASRLVCSAIAVISLTTSPMRPADCDNAAMRASVLEACVTASVAILLDPAMLAVRQAARLFTTFAPDSGGCIEDHRYFPRYLPSLGAMRALR
jgi:hypothetical protein